MQYVSRSAFLSLFNLTNFKTHAWNLLILVAFRELRQRLKLSLSGSVYTSAYRRFMITEKVQLVLSACAHDIFINMTCRRSILFTRHAAMTRETTWVPWSIGPACHVRFQRWWSFEYKCCHAVARNERSSQLSSHQNSQYGTPFHDWITVQ